MDSYLSTQDMGSTFWLNELAFANYSAPQVSIHEGTSPLTVDVRLRSTNSPPSELQCTNNYFLVNKVPKSWEPYVWQADI